jgi:hypothetical protein
MNLKINKMNEYEKHRLARMFMKQFPLLEPMSLDEFLSENGKALYPEQLNLGYYILALFDE